MSAKYSIFICIPVFITLLFETCRLPDPVTLAIPDQKSKIIAFCEVFRDTTYFYQEAVVSRTTNLSSITWDFKKGDTLAYTPDTIIQYIFNHDTVYYHYYYFLALNDGNQNTDYVKNAKVEMFDTETHKLFTRYNPNTFLKNFYSTDSISPEEGRAYTLQISAPGFDTISSTQTAPRNVFLDKARFVKNGYTLTATGTIDVVELTFQDPSLLANYYTAQIYSRTKDSYNGNNLYPAYLIKIDPGATDARFISDKNFDGQRYVWRIGINLFGQDSTLNNLRIEFHSTSKDYNTYIQAQDAAQKTIGNPFAEPVTPFTNFKNGLGLFVISGKLDTLSIPIR